MLNLKDSNEVLFDFKNPMSRWKLKTIQKMCLVILGFSFLSFSIFNLLELFYNIPVDIIYLGAGFCFSFFPLSEMYMNRIERHNGNFFNKTNYYMLPFQILISPFISLPIILLNQVIIKTFLSYGNISESFQIIILLQVISLIMILSIWLFKKIYSIEASDLPHLININNENEIKYKILLKEIKKESNTIEKTEYYIKAATERKYSSIVEELEKQKSAILKDLNFNHIDEYHIDKIEKAENGNHIAQEILIHNE